MPRPTEVLISLSALRHNLRLVSRLAPTSRAWAVIKADAYGHGMEVVWRALHDADGFAMVEFAQARRLREQGWSGPILMLEGAFDAEDVHQALADRLSLVIHESRQIDWLSACPDDVGFEVYLKLNSGMNRLGFQGAEFRSAFSRLQQIPAVRSITLMTHFANADLAGGTDSAVELFERITSGLPGARSLSNSAAILSLPHLHRDWVRPGIMLYGASPFADRDASALGLRPVMSFRSRLISRQRVAAGEAVGYGSTFVANQDMDVGIVACGYADGYPRHAPTGTPVAIAGVRTRTLGRVSMDMLAVDLGPCPDAGPGDEVELWGRHVSVDEVASSAGTISYELTCAIAPRVARRTVDDGL